MKKLNFATTALFCIVAFYGHAETVQQLSVTPSIKPFTVMPVINSVSISPSGKKLAIVRATSQNGDYIIEIRDSSNLSAAPVTLGADRMLVSAVEWLNDEKVLVIFRQLLKTGATKRWVNKIAITSADGKGNWLVPFRDSPWAGFTIVDSMRENSDEILVEADLEGKGSPNVVRFNINTGRTVTEVRGSDKVNGGFIVDNDGEVRAGRGFNLKENGFDQFIRAKGDSEWKLLKTISPVKRETFEVLGFVKENPNEAYILANMDQDTTGLYTYDILKKTYSERLFGLDGVDTDGIMQDRKGNLLGIRYTEKWPVRYLTDEKAAQLYATVEGLFPGKHIELVSRSLDENNFIIKTTSGRDPGTFYLLNEKQQMLKIGNSQPLLTEDILSDVKYITYTARDGRKIKAYVTVPKGKGPHPAIVMPHGGPWVRDTVVFDEWSQLLASHGYIVIQPNYRGSTGYGLEHWTAGDQNWGLKMQDDLDDAAMYLVNAGLTTKDKLAMFGWSYGGYAAFAGSMRDNNIYQCTVAGAGVSDLSRINATLNENRYAARLQRPTIKGVNPLEHVNKVNIPILVIHGDIDIRVPVSHSRDFVEKLIELKKEHKYVELVDADHFSNTLFSNHKEVFYPELLNWLDNKCGLKN